MHNLLLRTDTYNRTMAYLAGDTWNAESTYTLQLRRSPWDYLVITGMADLLQFLTRPVTKSDVEQAQNWYQTTAHVKLWKSAMWDLVLANNGYLPVEISAVPDGTMVRPGDPIMRVTGPSELCAHIEPLLHRIFYQSLVATHAHVISNKVGPDRFLEVGYRSAINDQQHASAVKAAYVGGGIYKTSADVSAFSISEIMDGGTLGHRYLQAFPETNAAFNHAAAHLNSVSLLVDLDDPIQGIDAALSVQAMYQSTQKTIGIRLDSGDLLSQVQYIFSAYEKCDWTNPKQHPIVVEGFSSEQQLWHIEDALSETEKAFVIYGAGSLLISHNKTRGAASSAYKLSEIDKRPVMKWSGDIGKKSIPGRPTLAENNGTRWIAQVGEFEQEVLQKVYLGDGQLHIIEDLQTARRQCVNTQYVKQGPQKTPMSPQTQAIIEGLEMQRRD